MESIAHWAATGLVFVGLCYTIWRNGSHQAKANDIIKTELKMEIGNIKEKLDDEHFGLGAIKDSIDEQKLHCASITGDYGARIKRLEEKR